jgi:hypothetical protein
MKKLNYTSNQNKKKNGEKFEAFILEKRARALQIPFANMSNFK